MMRGSKVLVIWPVFVTPLVTAGALMLLTGTVPPTPAMALVVP